jgi:hypothetical protein
MWNVSLMVLVARRKTHVVGYSLKLQDKALTRNRQQHAISVHFLLELMTSGLSVNGSPFLLPADCSAGFSTAATLSAMFKNLSADAGY